MFNDKKQEFLWLSKYVKSLNLLKIDALCKLAYGFNLMEFKLTSFNFKFSRENCRYI